MAANLDVLAIEEAGWDTDTVSDIDLFNPQPPRKTKSTTRRPLAFPQHPQQQEDEKPPGKRGRTDGGNTISQSPNTTTEPLALDGRPLKRRLTFGADDSKPVPIDLFFPFPAAEATPPGSPLAVPTAAPARAGRAPRKTAKRPKTAQRRDSGAASATAEQQNADAESTAEVFARRPSMLKGEDDPIVAAMLDRLRRRFAMSGEALDGESRVAALFQCCYDVTSVELNAVLRSVFGHSEFHGVQEHTVQRVLRGQSTLAIMPTGCGKSLCYQIPAYIFSRVARDDSSHEAGGTFFVLVVSPLVALMQDQAASLPVCLQGCPIGSTKGKSAENAFAAVQGGRLQVIFVSPERVVDAPTFMPSLQRVAGQLACICMDEAHCVTQWGENFRSSYRSVVEVLQRGIGARPVLGLTATCSERVVRDVCKVMNIQRCSADPTQDGVLSFWALRQNLKLSVTTHGVPNGMDSRNPYWQSRVTARRHELLDLIRGLDAQEKQFGKSAYPAIVYCRTQYDCETIADEMRLALNEDVKPYHAGMGMQQRTQVQQGFMSGQVKIVVGTVAFGLGINKADVRTVVHYNMPRSLEEYVQQIGRAGRDGEHATCHVFVDPADYVNLAKTASANDVDVIPVRKFLSQILGVGKEMENAELFAAGKPVYSVLTTPAATAAALDMQEAVLETLVTSLAAKRPDLLIQERDPCVSIKVYPKKKYTPPTDESGAPMKRSLSVATAPSPFLTNAHAPPITTPMAVPAIRSWPTPSTISRTPSFTAASGSFESEDAHNEQTQHTTQMPQHPTPKQTPFLMRRPGFQKIPMPLSLPCVVGGGSAAVGRSTPLTGAWECAEPSSTCTTTSAVGSETCFSDLCTFADFPSMPGTPLTPFTAVGRTVSVPSLGFAPITPLTPTSSAPSTPATWGAPQQTSFSSPRSTPTSRPLRRTQSAREAFLPSGVSTKEVYEAVGMEHPLLKSVEDYLKAYHGAASANGGHDVSILEICRTTGLPMADVMDGLEQLRQSNDLMYRRENANLMCFRLLRNVTKEECYAIADELRELHNAGCAAERRRLQICFSFLREWGLKFEEAHKPNAENENEAPLSDQMHEELKIFFTLEDGSREGGCEEGGSDAEGIEGWYSNLFAENPLHGFAEDNWRMIAKQLTETVVGQGRAMTSLQLARVLVGVDSSMYPIGFLRKEAIWRPYLGVLDWVPFDEVLPATEKLLRDAIVGAR